MAQQLKKSLVCMALTMLVMAFTVSAARRHLLQISVPVDVPPLSVNQDAGVVRAHGTTEAPMNGCLNVKSAGVKPCGNLTTTPIGGAHAPAVPLPPSPSPPPPPAPVGY